jgi:predicted O-methyltransferase YrrM
MRFKYYLRKSSFKKDKNSAQLLLKEIENHKPKNFLEVGVFQGVTSRNVCEILNKLHDNNFNYYGVDLFEDTDEETDLKESTSKHNKISNPFKHFLFNIILKQNLNSMESVNKLLKKFKNNIYLIKGFSRDALKKIDFSKIDFIFLDGGHAYETVREDLEIILKDIKKNMVIICDDYNQEGYGVKKAVDELKDRVTDIIKLNERLVKIIT